MSLPDADILGEELTGTKVCNKVHREHFWVWELYASDIYRRPTSTLAKCPYFFSYAFHHDGIVLADFGNEGKEPSVSKVRVSFENADKHWSRKFHPYIQNQWVMSTYNESQNAPLPAVQWASNQFRLTTDDAGIGILCTKGALFIGVHFFSTGTQENYEDFGFRLFFRLRKMHANHTEILQKVLQQQMGVGVIRSEATHYGDTGVSIMEEENIINDFWDNSMLQSENKNIPENVAMDFDNNGRVQPNKNAQEPKNNAQVPGADPAAPAVEDPDDI